MPWALLVTEVIQYCCGVRLHIARLSICLSMQYCCTACFAALWLFYPRMTKKVSLYSSTEQQHMYISFLPAVDIYFEYQTMHVDDREQIQRFSLRVYTACVCV